MTELLIRELARRGRRAARARPASPPSASAATVATKAAVLRRLELDVSRRLDGMLSGDHLAITAGPGTEAAGARPYGPGDDARRIDWSLTARSLDLHVRTTEADRELETILIADRSASLDFGTAQREKREVVLAAVAAFGSLTIRSGNRLGLVVAGADHLTQVPPRAGRAGLLASMAMLYDTPRRTTPPAVGADLAGALSRIEKTQKRRAQVVVISDFLDRGDWAAPLRRLALRHQVIAVQISDPREFELPRVGMLSVVDAETGRHLHVQTNASDLRERYAAAARQRDHEIRRLIAAAGAERLALSTDRDWLVDVVRFVGGRRLERGVAQAADAGNPARARLLSRRRA